MASARRLPVAYNDSTFGDGTRDYTSYTAWEAATDNDLVTATSGEVLTCHPDVSEFSTSNILSMLGATVDASYFRVLRGNDPTDKPKFDLQGTGRMELRESFSSLYDLELRRTIDQATGEIVIVRMFSSGGTNHRAVGLNCTDLTVTGGATNWAMIRQGAEDDLIADCFCSCKDKTERGCLVSPGAIGLTAYGYNITVVGATLFGITRSSGDTILKNCLIKAGAGATAAFEGGNTGSTNNASSDTSAPGTNARTEQTFTFVDEGNGDLHLASGDAGAKGFGVDLSGDSFFPFDDDIDGETITTWSIGADAQVATGSRDGNLTETLADGELSSSAAVEVSGAAAMEAGDSSLVSAGTTSGAGNLTVTLDDAGVSAVGAVLVSAESAETLEAATLSASGTSGVVVEAKIDLTLHPRSLAMSLHARSTNLTLQARTVSLTLVDRD